tara:strand:- start:8381 stop:9007 length:627 start_codon:yes stop_codon:yes gene_type:complete
MAEFCQLKLKNLENGIKKILDNTHVLNIERYTRPHHINILFKSKGRNKNEDGFYFITIVERGSISHGVLIRKSTKNSSIEFSLFDPNGKGENGGDDYTINILLDNKKQILNDDISPNTSWNKSGNCGLWGTILVILYHKYGNNARKINKFYNFMDKGYGLNNNGSRWISYMKTKYIDNNKNYVSTIQIQYFIDNTIEEIDYVINNNKF